MLNFAFQGDFRMIFGSVRRLESLSRQPRLPSTFVGEFRSLGPFVAARRLEAPEPQPIRTSFDSAAFPRRAAIHEASEGPRTFLPSAPEMPFFGLRLEPGSIKGQMLRAFE